MKRADHITTKAPGRICLFGDHQDYLGLPIIACSINRYINIEAITNDKMELVIDKKDIEEKDVIQINETLDNIENGDLLRLSIKVLRRYGCVLDRGFNICISGDIPINAGLSSSSALTVAWVKFLIEAYGIEQEVTKELIALLAYEVEVLETSGSGGKMDQFTISHGGIIFLDTTDDRIREIPNKIDNLIVGVSGIAKDTEGTLSHLKNYALLAIEQVRKEIPDFDIRNFDETNLTRVIDLVDDHLKPILQAAVMNYKITLEAMKELNRKSLDYTTIGRLMTSHHHLLRDNLKITVPRIDAMIQASLSTGAYGAKIVGSGGGGCIVAMGDGKNNLSILNALVAAGAVDAFEVH